ncbi:MAG: hypothetical protein E7360_06250 [Clostridiales bacterium]|nr:hypothetical protein [Clostridiales bacterium]
MSHFKIKELKTEYRINPLGIFTKKPRFSWSFTEETDETQTAYSISVSNRNKTVWSTGIVQSSNNINVEYAGEELKSSEIYNVSLCVYSKTSVAETVGTFETALLNESDWLAMWSGSNAVFTETTTVARKVFYIEDKPVDRARVYLLGIGYHELYINGKKVGDEFLAPSNSDYTKSLYYKVYDITNYISVGNNTIVVEIGYGWYGKKSFLLQMFAEYKDGTRFADYSTIDGLWKVGGGAITRNTVFGGETHDNILLEKIGDYYSPDYYADWNNGWMFAFHQLKEAGQLLPDQTDPIRITGEYKPVSATKVGNDTVYDFGKNIAGWVELKAKGSRGTKISMRFAEGLNADGTINQLNLRTATCLDEIILSGNGEEVFEPKFTYHGFQYMQLSINGDAEILSVTAKHVHNDVKQTGEFSCSDELLNTLHDNVLRTEKNNLHSIMTDCPQRDERIGWLNDLSSRAFQNIVNFDLSRMIPKILRDIKDTQNANGAIADTAPFLAGTIPADPVCASYILYGRLAYRYYGDKRVLEDYYDSYKSWINCLMSYTKDYILELSYYGDWVVPECYMDTRSTPAYVSTAYLYWQLKLMSEIAEILGKSEDKDLYQKMSNDCATAINDKWFNKDLLYYDNNSQSANAMAISIGFAPEYAKQAIINHIKEDVVARDYHSTSGNQGYRHFFYVLGEEGETQLLLDVLKNPEYPGWGYMLANGATTIWERWEKTMQMEMHSFDHPMFGSFDGIFYHYLAGIKIDDDAYACDKVTIKPQWNNHLSEVKASLDTIRGKISVAWKKVDNKVEIALKIPATINAVLDFSGTINGKSFDKGYAVGGGEYSIICNL